jgi:hypothetical protein
MTQQSLLTENSRYLKTVTKKKKVLGLSVTSFLLPSLIPGSPASTVYLVVFARLVQNLTMAYRKCCRLSLFTNWPCIKGTVV